MNQKKFFHNIQSFLLSEEKTDHDVLNNLKVASSTNGIHSFVNEGYTTDDDNNQNESLELKNLDIVVSNVTGKWTTDQTEDTLQKINLTIKRGQLLAIIGPVGAGKVNIIQLYLII